MLSFREFEAGPDPFGRMWQVQFKWQQNGISLRHAETVDNKFILSSENLRQEKVIALPYPALLELSRETKRPLDDSWCSRIAAAHLVYMIETAEDFEKDMVTLTPAELAAAAGRIASAAAAR